MPEDLHRGERREVEFAQEFLRVMAHLDALDLHDPELAASFRVDIGVREGAGLTYVGIRDFVHDDLDELRDLSEVLERLVRSGDGPARRVVHEDVESPRIAGASSFQAGLIERFERLLSVQVPGSIRHVLGVHLRTANQDDIAASLAEVGEHRPWRAWFLATNHDELEEFLQAYYPAVHARFSQAQREADDRIRAMVAPDLSYRSLFSGDHISERSG